MIDFSEINAAARRAMLPLLRTWLPTGQVMGVEYVALNPRRNDRHLGSFRINLRTGKWADFATGDRGGDVISLLAFILDSSQTEAALRISALVGLREFA